MILNKYFLENPTLHHTAITLQQTPALSASYSLRQSALAMGSLVAVFFRRHSECGGLSKSPNSSIARHSAANPK